MLKIYTRIYTHFFRNQKKLKEIIKETNILVFSAILKPSVCIWNYTESTPLTAENGTTDNCSAVFAFSIPKNIPKSLQK